MKERIIDIIYNYLDEINSEREPEGRIMKTESTILFGRASTLDSLGLVNLLLHIEKSVNEIYGAEIKLGDERAMTGTINPYADVNTLADYTQMLIMEKLPAL